MSNTTVEETSPDLLYTGNWTTNSDPAFSGGGSIYTKEDGATVSLSFHGTYVQIQAHRIGLIKSGFSGSALYIFGDVVKNHGLFTVTVDNGGPEQFNSIFGCSGIFGHYCEKKNTLAYFKGNLDSSLHDMTLTNNAGVDITFFGAQC